LVQYRNDGVWRIKHAGVFSKDAVGNLARCRRYLNRPYEPLVA
jgi:hypothetical protein